MKARPTSIPRRVAKALIAAAISLCVLPSLGAQASQELSLEDCLRLGAAASKSVAMEAAKTAAARARLDFSERQYFPSLVGSGSYTHSSLVEAGTITATPAGSPKPISIQLPDSLQDAALIRLGLQQPLFTGFRIEAGIRQAKAALDAAQADASLRRREASSAIVKAWWGLVLAQESSRVVEESAASITAHVAEAQTRLDRGIGLRAELLSARMRVDDLDALLSETRSALALSRARLNILMGLPWDAATAAPPPSEAATPGAVPEIAGLVERAKSSRSELASAASRLAGAEASVLAARSGLLPSVFLTGSYSLADPNPKAFPQRSGFESLWDIGILVSLDLGRIPAALSQAEEARATASQARLALAQAGDAVTFDLVSAWLELSKTADRLKATSSSVGLAEEALRSQRDRLAAGLALTTEVSDAETALLRAKLDRTRSRVAWELARAALSDALGEE